VRVYWSQRSVRVRGRPPYHGRKRNLGDENKQSPRAGCPTNCVQGTLGICQEILRPVKNRRKKSYDKARRTEKYSPKKLPGRKKSSAETSSGQRNMSNERAERNQAEPRVQYQTYLCPRSPWGWDGSAQQKSGPNIDNYPAGLVKARNVAAAGANH